ncbi:MAG: STAS domain-containing protein [Winogradskyella sp.]|uniref:STAS domain-containing protein n=1 Tax=Winogradskyella sp. TaxID=1883156 RepID=UPI00386003D2
MALTIREKLGVFLVEGVLNSATANSFKDRCEALLNTKGELTIHIENVTEIDDYGIHVIQTLFKNAKQTNKGFMVIGHITENIYNRLRNFSAAAIAA